MSVTRFAQSLKSRQFSKVSLEPDRLATKRTLRQRAENSHLWLLESGVLARLQRIELALSGEVGRESDVASLTPFRSGWAQDKGKR